MKKQKFVASFSGGKDSSLALYHAMQNDQAVGLIMMLEETGQRSRSHGMDLAISHAQAAAIGLPLIYKAATWQCYETCFMALLADFKTKGAQYLLTGDLDVPKENSWHEQVAAKVGLGLSMPLQDREHCSVVNELIDLGFVAMVVTVNLDLGMVVGDLGRFLDHAFVAELLARGIDPCGEGGEFHTTVLDGPIFNHPIGVLAKEIVQKDQYAFLPLALA